MIASHCAKVPVSDVCPAAGMIAVALTPNLKIAAVCTSYMVSLFHLFAGFVITQPNMPGWWYVSIHTQQMHVRTGCCYSCPFHTQQMYVGVG